MESHIRENQADLQHRGTEETEEFRAEQAENTVAGTRSARALARRQGRVRSLISLGGGGGGG